MAIALSAAACGGGSASVPTDETQASGGETTVVEREAEPEATAPPEPEVEATPPGLPPPVLPALTAGDAHTRVIGQIDGACSVDGVEGGFVYVGSSGRTSSLTRFALAGGAGEVVHHAEGVLDYRVTAGLAVYAELTEGFGITNFGAIRLSNGRVSEVGHGLRQSTWALAPGGIYYADPSYTEPRILRLSLSGGEPTQIEEIAPVFDEDRIEQLVASQAELFYVAVRTRDSSRGGYFCHELRGGPPGASQTLRRYRRCPSDDEILDAMTVTSGFVYYHRDEGLYRMPRAAGGREETVMSDVHGVPTATVSDDRVLVWAQQDGVLRLALGVPAVPEVIGERAQTLSAPYLADGVLYWTRRDPGQTCVVLSRPIDAPALTRWDPS
ncbi:MAG: hypothetical protein U0353_14435 [Sandaracinus sp.]